MKALTLWQPWASLVAFGCKRVETRSWSTSHRGELAIHAAKRIPFKDLGRSRLGADFKKLAESALGAGPLPVGCVLCTCRLVDVVPTSPELVADLTGLERLFGNYEPGRFAWFLEDVIRLETPVPAAGNRLLWNWKP